MHNWSEYILNAFDVPYSNGFTEGCNNKTNFLGFFILLYPNY